MSGLEWDVFLRRCIDNREAELEDIVNRVLRTMDVKPEEGALGPVEKINERNLCDRLPRPLQLHVMRLTSHAPFILALRSFSMSIQKGSGSKIS